MSDPVSWHKFDLHSSEGLLCSKCKRRWADVISQQPSWPGFDRENPPSQSSQGIACVGDLNAAELEWIEAEKQRVWLAVLDAAGRGYKATGAVDDDADQEIVGVF
jgi:hypothetical protein